MNDLRRPHLRNIAATKIWNRAWEENGDIPDNYHEQIVEALLNYKDNSTCSKILEVGAGTSRDSLILAELGNCCVALDLSPVALGISKQGALRRNVQISFLCGDTFQLPFPTDSFDVVFSQGLMEHFNNPQEFLLEQKRVLRPGGILLVDVPQTYNFYTLEKHFKMKMGKWFAGWETSYTLANLERLLKNLKFSVIGSYGSGYYPNLLVGVRNLHTIDERHDFWVKIPEYVRSSIERGWRLLEKKRWYYRWMWNVGVIAKKPAS